MKQFFNVRSTGLNCERHSLFKSKGTKRRLTRGFQELLRRYKKKALIKKIIELAWLSKICKDLGCNLETFNKLLDYHRIDYQKYRWEALKKKSLDRYYQVVKILGHHPAPSEMVSRKDWGSTYSLICRYWCGIDRFRKALGILKPTRKITPLSNAKIARMKKVEKIYGKYLNLQKTGDKLGITRERVRQLLNQGNEYGLFKYIGRRKGRFNKPLRKRNRKLLVN